METNTIGHEQEHHHSHEHEHEHEHEHDTHTSQTRAWRITSWPFDEGPGLHKS